MVTHMTQRLAYGAHTSHHTQEDFEIPWPHVGHAPSLDLLPTPKRQGQPRAMETPRLPPPRGTHPAAQSEQSSHRLIAHRNSKNGVLPSPWWLLMECMRGMATSKPRGPTSCCNRESYIAGARSLPMERQLGDGNPQQRRLTSCGAGESCLVGGRCLCSSFGGWLPQTVQAHGLGDGKSCLVVGRCLWSACRG